MCFIVGAETFWDAKLLLCNKMAAPFQCYLTWSFNMPAVVCLVLFAYETYAASSGFRRGLSPKYVLGQQIIGPTQLCSPLVARQRRVHHLPGERGRIYATAALNLPYFWCIQLTVLVCVWTYDGYNCSSLSALSHHLNVLLPTGGTSGRADQQTTSFLLQDPIPHGHQ